MSEELVREEKQKYLREHVMEKGYDIEKFVSYLQELKENGDNVDNWSMEELKAIVDKFAKIESGEVPAAPVEEDKADGAAEPITASPYINTPSEEAPSIPPAAPTPSSPKANMPVSPKASPSPDVKPSPANKYQIFRDLPSYIATRELPITELTNKKISIKVLQPVIKEGGIFSSTSVNYVIETQPMGWQVLRSYSEALWLREQLQKHFPGSIIPPLNKKGAKNKTAPKSIMKRINWLQQFFTELQRDQTLRSSDFFYYFFSLPQKPQFEAKKKELSKVPAPKTFADMKHLGGKFDNELSEHKVKLAKNIGGYIQNGQALYQQLLVATDSTVKVMLLLSDALARNADLFKQFGVLHANIECAEIADVFNTLKGINTGISELYAKQGTLIKDRFGDFFKYYKDELDSLKDVLHLYVVQEKLCNEYLKKEEQLYAKKEKLFSEGKIMSWDLRPEDLKAIDPLQLKADKGLAMQLMLTKETKKLQDQHVGCAYYTNKLLEGTRKMMVKNYRTMRKHFKEAADSNANIMKDMYDKWIEVSEHFNEKLSKFDRRERSELLYNLKEELGVKDELIEILA